MAKNRRKFAKCPNCSYTFKEVNNFCPDCGQENHDLNVPAKHLIAEFFEGILHFDTKVWQTLKLLILKPGLLTEKFNVGQRASYVAPFRLYVFVSLIFFFVVALTSETPDQVQPVTKESKKGQAILAGVTLTSSIPDSLLAGSDTVQAKKIDKFITGTKEGKALRSISEENGFAAAFGEKFTRFTSKGEEAKQKLLKNVSFMMFLLMPFFALLLYLYYRRLGRNYVEHLMFSIHLHTFYFILLIAAMLFGLLFPALDYEGVVFLMMMLYLLLAMHQVYKQSFLRALLSLLPIGVAYLITLITFFMGTIAVSVLMS